MAPPNCTAAAQPSGVEFRLDTLRQIGIAGDNWGITWAADDSQVVSMDDGNWLGTPQSYHNHLYRLVGSHTSFERCDVPNYPAFVIGEGA